MLEENYTVSSSTTQVIEPAVIPDVDEDKSRWNKAHSKLLRVMEGTGREGFGPRGIARTAGVSVSTAQAHLPVFVEEGVIIRDRPGHYVFNQNHPLPITLASFSAKLVNGAAAESYPVFKIQRGHWILTSLGEAWLNKISGLDHPTRPQQVDLANKIFSAGLRSLATVATIPSPFPARDPVTGKRLKPGDGDCPRCETGTMEGFSRCPVCGHQELLQK